MSLFWPSYLLIADHQVWSSLIWEHAATMARRHANGSARAAGQRPCAALCKRLRRLPAPPVPSAGTALNIPLHWAVADATGAYGVLELTGPGEWKVCCTGLLPYFGGKAGGLFGVDFCNPTRLHAVQCICLGLRLLRAPTRPTAPSHPLAKVVPNPDKVATNWPIPLSQADAARWKAQQVEQHGEVDGPVGGGACSGRAAIYVLWSGWGSSWEWVVACNGAGRGPMPPDEPSASWPSPSPAPSSAAV